MTTLIEHIHPHAGPDRRRAARPLRPPRCPRSRRAGPLPGTHLTGGEDGEDPAERGRRMCEALFASALQRSAAPAADSVAAAISRAVRRLGTRGCASRMAQEFGDHPQAAAGRMRWVRQLAAAAAAPAACEPGPEAAWPVPGARRPPGHDSARRRGHR
jgi:hypothetical protein